MVRDFVNRTSEKILVERFLKNQDAKLVSTLRVKPATGLSYFLKYISKSYNKEYIIIYIDGNYKVPNSLITQIFLSFSNNYPECLYNFEKKLNEKQQKENSWKYLSAAIGCIPYAGSFFKDVLVLNTERKMNFTPFLSNTIELIIPFLEELSREKNILFAIDNAQELDEWSIDFIRSTIGDYYTNIKYLIAFVDRKKTEVAFENMIEKIESTGYYIQSFEFNEPNSELINELAKLYNIKLEKKNCSEILLSTKKNIYKIVATLKKYNEFTDNTSSLGKAILFLIFYARQALRESDLISLILKSDNVFFKNTSEVSDTIYKLSNFLEINSLPDGDRLIFLKNTDVITEKTSNEIVYSSLLYEYYKNLYNQSQRHSSSEILLLLFRLSKIVDVDSIKFWVQEIVSLSLKMGSIEIAERFINESTLQDSYYSFEDFYIKISFLFSVRSYNKALDMLIQINNPEWLNHRIVKILSTLIYNRCRLFKKADELTKELLSLDLTLEEKVLLYSYSIGGYLHQNKVVEAQTLFFKEYIRLKKSKNFGYFLRNSASAFQVNKGISILDESLKWFIKKDDKFGTYSTKANLGQYYFRAGDRNIGYKVTLEAKRSLEIFGVHHLHIVLNNLGIMEMYFQEFDKALVSLKKSLSIAHTKMPELFININYALYELMTSRNSEAITRLTKIRNDIDKHSVDRLRQFFYINFAIALISKNNNWKLAREMVALSKKHPDRIQPEKSFEKIYILEKFIIKKHILSNMEILKYFSPCFMSYWYQNPLELLPDNILSF